MEYTRGSLPMTYSMYLCIEHLCTFNLQGPPPPGIHHLKTTLPFAGVCPSSIPFCCWLQNHTHVVRQAQGLPSGYVFLKPRRRYLTCLQCSGQFWWHKRGASRPPGFVGKGWAFCGVQLCILKGRALWVVTSSGPTLPYKKTHPYPMLFGTQMLYIHGPEGNTQDGFPWTITCKIGRVWFHNSRVD
jgi:hypothetical protein